MSDTKAHRDLIHALGGSTAVAAELGEERSAVANWLSRGVPWRKRYAVQQLAKRKRVPVPDKFLEAA